MRFSYLLLFAALLWCSACQKETIRESLHTADLPVFEGRSLVVKVLTDNPSHCGGQSHEGTTNTSMTVSNANISLYDLATFKSGDALPIAEARTDSYGVVRFDELELDQYQVVILVGATEVLRSSTTPDQKITYLTVELN